MTPEKYFLNSALVRQYVLVDFFLLDMMHQSVHTDSNQFKLGFDPRSAFTFTGNNRMV